MSDQPIDHTIEQWHRFLEGDLPGGLDELLHDDARAAGLPADGAEAA